MKKSAVRKLQTWKPHHLPDLEPQTVDPESFFEALKLSKLEMEIARQQFDVVTEPLLIDHVVFRLGAAERHFNYLIQLARQMNLNVPEAITSWWMEEA